VISVYVPNGESLGSDKFAYKLEFLRALRNYLAAERSPEEMLCLAGDFNVAPEPIDVHDPVAWDGQVLFSEPERTEIEELRALGFVDCLRKHHAEGGVYSWWDYRGGAFWKGQGLRIDHLWATRLLAERCVSCEIDLSPRKWKKPSDHAPVRAEFAL
jgi:exodeoxyribonuclease-3